MKLEIFAADEWAPAVGARLVRFVSLRNGLRVCLATGSTPEPVYAEFTASGGSLEGTEVFLLDEFLLPVGDLGRCDEMLDRALLQRLPTPPDALYTFDVTAASLQEECERFEDVIADGGLDLAVVGLGGNGHIGMNEPGSRSDSRTRVVELDPSTQQNAARYGATARPTWGITLGMGTLLAAEEIWLLVSGRHKAEILERAVSGPIGPEVPASYLRQHGNTIVYADEPAAALLS
ncbi:MAG: glucosamine-6-phosphate deaminase [Acidimicrobiia bacterium]|nr:glucosamine-6-phosphate deaminase [Acidimicrobiia bacterium]